VHRFAQNDEESAVGGEEAESSNLASRSIELANMSNNFGAAASNSPVLDVLEAVKGVRRVLPPVVMGSASK